MSTLLDLVDSSSDSEDFDFVPTADLRQLPDEDEVVSSDEAIIPKKKKGQKANKAKKKVSEETKVEEAPVEDEKQKANDIWKSFLDEVAEVKTQTILGIASEVSLPISLDSIKEKECSKTSSLNSCGNQPEKVNKLLLEFAGEVVSVTSDGCLKPHIKISSDSQSPNNAKAEKECSRKEAVLSVIPSVKRKGLESILNTIGNKKQKITTLQKTLIDWKSFKREEGIEDELEKFNRGKGGYIERQRFLERSDLRSFEVEKATRLSRAK